LCLPSENIGIKKYFYCFDVGARFIEPAKDGSDESDPYNKHDDYVIAIMSLRGAMRRSNPNSRLPRFDKLSSILLSSPLRGED